MLSEDRQCSLVEILIALREDDPEFRYSVSALSWRAGQVVAEPTALACGVFILMMGRVQLTREGPDGPRMAVTTLDPGDAFGEDAQPGSFDPTVSANALTDCIAWMVPAPRAREFALLAEQMAPPRDV